jgi:purine-binding chemotaxis protein CheW
VRWYGDHVIDGPDPKEKNMAVVEKINQVNAAGAREYLTFRLDQEEYGIDILMVQEIRGYEPPTRIANAPNFIKGVVNLRGTIVPIVDMRLKFGCSKAEYDSFTVVIILNLRSRIVGIVVDSVSDVMELPAENVKAAPDIESVIDSSAVLGLGSLGDRMLILLDIEKLMSGVDMGLASE